MNEVELEERIRGLRRQGNHLGIVCLLESLAAVPEISWRVAITAARAEMGAGRIRGALRWLDAVADPELHPNQRALLDLDRAQCGIYENLDFRAGLAAAQQAENLFAQDFASDSNRTATEARWAIVRLRLLACQFGEARPAIRDELIAELPELQARFSALGLIDTAHDVAFAHAERAETATAVAAWEGVVERASADGLSGIVGEALLRKATVVARTGALDAEVLEVVRQAEESFEAMGHCHGLIDCDRKRAEVRIERRGAGLEALAACVDRYLAVGYPKGALSTLGELSSRAHARSDRELTLKCQRDIDRLAEKHGFGMMKKMAVFTAADLALRERRDGLARDLCDAALAEGLPRMLEAGLFSLRASSLSFAGSYYDAVDARRRAISLYEELDREDEAADQIPALASDLASSLEEPDLESAEALLVEWIARDRRRSDLVAALAKTAQRAELRILRVVGRRARGEADQVIERELISEANALLEEVRSRIPEDAQGREWGLLIGTVGQVEGQIAATQGRDEGAEHALERSLCHFEKFGFGYEAANCHYLLGCLCLNRANTVQGQDFAQHADAAQDHLSQALTFYETVAGMRHMAAQTRHKQAMLYLNVQHRVSRQAAADLLRTAEAWLREAADVFDVLRRAYDSSDRWETFAGKMKLSAAAAAVASDAFRLHLSIAPDPQKGWEWVVRSKSEALDDLLGAQARVPASLEAVLDESPLLAEQVSTERFLANRLAVAPAAERLSLDKQLTGVRAAMREHSALREYVDLRTGAAAGSDDLALVASEAPTPFALVDWVFQGSAVWLLVARSGESPLFERLPLDRERVQAFVENDLSSRDFRFTLRDDPGTLDALDPLVAPLALYTRSEEPLILCPSGLLHALPLHALAVDGGPLIARNPVSYTPSLGVLRLCCQREHRRSSTQGATVFGDPTGDRPEAEAVARRIADTLGVSPVLGEDVTEARLDRAMAESTVIHYQGHALHDRASPLSSRLQLARGETFEAQKLFSLRHVLARMFILGACESAAAVVRDGDEQLGLIPALLVAGVRAVTAADWKIDERSAAAYMETYYEELKAGAYPAQAARTAALEVRSNRRWSAPYYWAAYSVHGDPWSTILKEESTQ
jgi:CHAT domain-containing protein